MSFRTPLNVQVKITSSISKGGGWVKEGTPLPLVEESRGINSGGLKLDPPPKGGGSSDPEPTLSHYYCHYLRQF